jgi:hypothetical protein
MRDVATGGTIHGHKLLGRLGEGLYGEVWRAEYAGHEVALKVFNRGRRPAHLKRELFAQYALGRLEGEDARWFPRVEHLDLDADPPYVRMELIDGTPLETLLANPSLPLDERLQVGEQVLRALAVVHAHDFVHGDLSPLNVLVTADRGVRLIDVGFGALVPDGGDIALSTTEEDRNSGVASPLYSAPERFKSAPTEGCGKPSDIFSFGKLLYRLITGEQPFVIKPVSLKFRVLGAAWDDFLFRCLEERPEARFADAAAALAEYRRIYRPEPAAGEYRAECPECRASQVIPGGWAGERFDCRGCGRTIEVLFYDDPSRHAATALVTPEVPPILFLDRDAEAAPPPARARKFCPSCGGEMKVEAKKCRHCGVWADEEARKLVAARAEARRSDPLAVPDRSFLLPAVLTLIGYAVFWVPGAILNWHFLGEARKQARATGREPHGAAALRVLVWILFYLPLIGLGAALVLGLLGGAVVALAR